MAHRRRLLLTLGALGTTTLAAGCLDDGATDDTDTGAPTDDPPGTTMAPEGDAQEQYPDYDWEQLDGVAPEPASTVTMRGFAFVPLVATVPPGTELTVTNEDSASHTITVPALDVEATLGEGESTSFVVERTGTVDYVCEFHAPDMLGRLVVADDAGTPTAPPSDGDTPTATDTEDEGGYY